MKRERIRLAYLETAVDIEHGSFEAEHPVAKADRRIRLSVKWRKPDLRHCSWTKLILAIQYAEVRSIPGMAVVLKIAETAPAYSLGRHVRGAGGCTILDHCLLKCTVHFLVRRESSPSVAYLGTLRLLLAWCGCLLDGSCQGVGLLKQTG